MCGSLAWGPGHGDYGIDSSAIENEQSEVTPRPRVAERIRLRNIRDVPRADQRELIGVARLHQLQPLVEPQLRHL